MVRFDVPVQLVYAAGRTDTKGLCAAAEEIGKPPFGEIPWSMSGNASIAVVLG
jgi:hypothetical protein